MIEFARRELLGAAAAGLGVISLPLQARSSVPLPSGAMILARRVERPLSDGQKIVVTRKWLVAFSDTAQGIMVAGRQIDVIVDAPARLAPLADVERSRSTDGMFPILLTESGLIASAGKSETDDDVARAARAAESMIAASGASADQVVAAGQVLAQLQMASSSLFDNLPPDLFFPSGRPIHNIQPVNLPDGSHGEFELDYVTQPATPGSWLHHASRRIETRLGSDARQSTEEWSLEPA